MNGYKFVTDTLKSKKEAPQQDTPTITLLKNRGDKRVEADGIFRLNYKVYNMKRQASLTCLGVLLTSWTRNMRKDSVSNSP